MQLLKFTTLVFLFFFFQSFKINAQQTWDLQRCINYAAANNLQLRQQKVQLEMEEEYLEQAKHQRYPSLNAGFEHQFGTGQALSNYTFSAIDNAGSVWISSNMNVFNGFQVHYGIKEQEFNLLSTLQDYEAELDNITLNIASSYLEILFDKELIKINEAQMEVTAEQVDRMKKLVESGNRAEGDLLEIEAQQANERYDLVVAKNQLVLDYLQLKQIMYLDTVSDFVVEEVNIESIDTIIPLSFDEVYAYALEQLPYIKSAEYEVLANTQNVYQNKGLRYPRLYLQASYSSRYQSTDDIGAQLDNNRNGIISAGIQIPIFNRRNAVTNINISHLALEQAELQFQQVKLNVYNEVQQAYNDAIAALEKYKAAQEAVRSNQRAFVYTGQKYSAGIVNSLEYNQAKTILNQAESELLRAKYEYVFKVKILDFYAGREINI